MYSVSTYSILSLDVKSQYLTVKTPIIGLLRHSEKKILEKMHENNLEGRIAIKQKEAQVEQDPNRKAQLQRDLEILNLRKQIEYLRDKIKMKQGQQ